MTEKWLFQVRLYFSSDFTKTFNSDKNSKKKEKLITVLNKHNAELLSQFDGFMGYVLEAEKNGIDNYPLYQWTKDSLTRKDKLEKYHNSYTVYINTEEVYSENLANNIENDLLELVDKETVLRISKHDTNPKNNPQPPSKYQ
tara:strand:+ start:1681 stop:2106 length:426 start_codon:yes stop_codon:yes gene_type:complete